MKRTSAKTLSLLALAAFPFIAGCSSPSERIHKSIQAGVPVSRADVFATIKGWESPWAMHGTGGQIFSLFEYAVKKGELDLLDFCLANKSRPVLAEAQTNAYVESVVAKISVNDAAEREVKICEKIWTAGLALSTKPKLEAKQREVEEERATRFVESVIAGISVNRDASEGELTRCREYWDAGLALSMKPKLEAKLKQVEEERRKPVRIKSERQLIFQSLQYEIFPAEQKLSESERSRGRTLLDAFGEEHMPRLTEKCGEARRKYLEADANLEELIKALKAENIDLKTNDVYQAAERNWLSLAADYWQLRYTLTDYYSQFKIGVITSDELAAEDGELVTIFAEAEKINLAKPESK